jgi:MFS-type transporter involved in bile tolerance (Atg22 family)
MALIGISAALLPAPLFSLAAQVVSRDRLGRAFGALAMLNNFGVFIGPQLVGLSRDITGSYRAGFGLIAILASMAAVMSGILRARRGRRKEH